MFPLGLQNVQAPPAKTEEEHIDDMLERIEQIVFCVTICAFVLDKVEASTSASHLITRMLEHKSLDSEHTEMLSVVLGILKGSD